MWSRVYSSIRNKSSTFFKDGSFEITVGSCILSVYAVDRYLLYKREDDISILKNMFNPFSDSDFFNNSDNEQQKEQEHQMRKAVLEQLRYEVEQDHQNSQTDSNQKLASVFSGTSKSKRNDDHLNGTMILKDATLPSTPILFQCKVRKIPAMFDGTMSLKGTHLGDIVDVIQKNVGPSGMYHLCRSSNVSSMHGKEEIKNRVGWFPISHLEKLD